MLRKFRYAGITSDLLTITPGSSISLSVTGGQAMLGEWAAGQNATVAITGTQEAGQVLILLIKNDATAARTITFGTGFSASGNLVGTVSKTASIMFASDGGKFFELCRTTGLTS